MEMVAADGDGVVAEEGHLYPFDYTHDQMAQALENSPADIMDWRVLPDTKIQYLRYIISPNTGLVAFGDLMCKSILDTSVEPPTISDASLVTRGVISQFLIWRMNVGKVGKSTISSTISALQYWFEEKEVQFPFPKGPLSKFKGGLYRLLMDKVRKGEIEETESKDNFEWPNFMKVMEHWITLPGKKNAWAHAYACCMIHLISRNNNVGDIHRRRMRRSNDAVTFNFITVKTDRSGELYLIFLSFN